MKTAIEILKEGRELIAEPERWTQFAASIDKTGRFVLPASDDACAWCSIGALCRVATVKGALPIDADWYLEEAMGEGIDAFNDTHTHAEVLAAWDRAIEGLES